MARPRTNNVQINIAIPIELLVSIQLKKGKL